MGAKAEGVDFVLPFVFDPAKDEVFGEDVSGEEPLVVFLESVEGGGEAPGCACEVGFFFWGEVVDVFIEGFSGVHLVSYTVDGGHGDGCEGEVWVCAGVWAAEFEAFEGRF